MNCLNSLLSKDGAIVGAEVGVRDTTGVDRGVLLLLVKTAAVSSSFPVGGGFQQVVRQVQGLVIAVAE